MDDGRHMHVAYLWYLFMANHSLTQVNTLPELHLFFKILHSAFCIPISR